jgi:Ser/Thr protein kinase RdoA (MazF antagonist)
VKELFSSGDETAARADVAFQEAALGAGVPMPRPVLSRAGDVLVRLDTADRAMVVRLYTWVDLRGRDAAVPPAQAAAILGKLHALAVPIAAAPDAWYTSARTPDELATLVERVEQARAAWAPIFADLITDLVAAAPIVAAGRHTPAFRCHLDYNPENVLVDLSGRPVVVDWENSGASAAEQELASSVAEFVRDPADIPAFLAAYAEAGGPAELRDRSSFAMTLAVLTNLVAWYAERALDQEESTENRARSIHWIRDIAANRVTVAHIDRWLAAARHS